MALLFLPAGQKYPNSNSNSAVDETKSQVFKNLCDLQVLPQFQSDVDTKERESDTAQPPGASYKKDPQHPVPL